ncbi:MAG TPA: hypothetical protein VMZ05_03520 [Spirochaetota bacterium]|nr:hypothetical protein [Spirochaetota bacterium]
MMFRETACCSMSQVKTRRRCAFKSPLPSGCPEVDRAVAYLYESANSRGAVVFVHGMGRRSLSWPRF